MTPAELQTSVQHLRDELLDVLTAYGEKNPHIPAQALMAGIGELLIQVSVGQVGPGMTLKFLDDLKQAVQHFAPNQH